MNNFLSYDGFAYNNNVKGALSDFCQTMLIFESTKTNTPIPQQDLATILTSPTHTYVHNPVIMTIMKTSEDDTQAYSNKSQHK